MSTLAEVFTTRSGGYWGRDHGSADVDALAIRNGDVGTTGEIRWSSLPKRGYTRREFEKARIRAGDIVLTSSGNCGNSAFIGREPTMPTVATNFVRVLRVDPAIADARYAFHFLRSHQFLAGISPHVRGATIKNLSVEAAFQEIEVPLPPVAEQRRIAAILDSAATILTKRRKTLDYLGSLAQAIFHDMFGDVRSNTYGFETATVDDIADRVTDGEHKTPRRTQSGVPLLSARNIRDGWIDFDNTDFVDEEEFALLSRRIEPREGDVLISCSGSIGRVARVTDRSRFAMVRSTALVRPSVAVLPPFLERLLSTPSLRALMVAQANSSAQANLFQNQIKRLPVVVPPLHLQEEFSERLKQVDRQATYARKARDLEEELFRSLQSRAFREEL